MDAERKFVVIGDGDGAARFTGRDLGAALDCACEASKGAPAERDGRPWQVHVAEVTGGAYKRVRTLATVQADPADPARVVVTLTFPVAEGKTVVPFLDRLVAGPAFSDSRLDTDERMSRLAESFPCLDVAAGVRPWSPTTLQAWAATASSGQRWAVSFLLTVVWNYQDPCHGEKDWRTTSGWKLPRFNLGRAMNCWSGENLRAFQAWINNPFTA